MAVNIFNITLENGTKYELTQPEWLWLIPAVIISSIILNLIKNKFLTNSTPCSLADTSSKNLLLHPLINTLDLNLKNRKLKSAFKPTYIFSFIFLVVALTQPVKVGKKLPDPPQERDIIFIVDTSVSMILRDYVLDGERIDRMSLLKGVLDNFIRELKGEKMSVIVFGDNAYTLVPLTSDQYLLRRMLSRVEATMAGRFNAIGNAIALAVKQATDNKKNSKRKKILVLLTDADQPTGDIDPVVAAMLAKKAQLPLYTIAIGATTIAADEQRLGGLLYSPVDLELINKLSNITGAKSYQAGNPNALESAVQAINLHETNIGSSQPQYFREAQYYWFTIIAFILFSTGQLLNIAVNFRHKAKK